MTQEIVGWFGVGLGFLAPPHTRQVRGMVRENGAVARPIRDIPESMRYRQRSLLLIDTRDEGETP